MELGDEEGNGINVWVAAENGNYKDGSGVNNGAFKR